MDDRIDIDPDLITRYLADACSIAERHVVERWIAGSPERAAVVDELRAMARAQGRLPRPVDVDAAWRAADQSIRGMAGSRAVAAAPRVTLRRQFRWVLVASAVIEVAALVVMFGHSPRRHGAASREYATRAGQRMAVTLRDGTHITLGPASVLHVPVDYAAGDRAVTLDGEGYFAVVHSPAHPFSVRARNVVATDIGTQFEVRAYANDRDVRIAVADGIVGIGARRLAAGDLAMVADTVVAITHDADVATLTAWTTGRLAFDHTPLADALADLSRWYDLDLVLGDSALRAHEISGSINAQSPAEMLDAIALLANARYVRVGRRVIFTSATQR